MSDTPRTDDQELAYEAEDGSTYVHTTFARKLEREIRQLEVAIYDLRTEYRQLQDALTLACEDRDYFVDLYKMEKERLDWLLDENSCTHIERGRYNRFRDWLVKTLHNRSDIDREMETYDFNEIIRDEELTNE